MTEASGHIRAGDRVTLRGSNPPKMGDVIDVLTLGAGWIPGGLPQASDPANMAWVSWKGAPKPVAEELNDLVKLA